MMCLRLIIICVLGIFAVGVRAQNPIFTTAKTKAVTVYFSGAEMLQTMSVNLPVGMSEVVVKNISNFVDENTIRVAVPPTVTVLSAQFTTEYLSEYKNVDLTPELKRVKDSVELIISEIKKLDNSIQTDHKAIELLDKNNQTYTSQQGLNVAELEKMVAFYRSKRLDLQTNIDNQTALMSKKQTLLGELQARMTVNPQDAEKVSNGKIVLQLMSETAAKVNLDITYISKSAFWIPCYDFKVENVSKPAVLVYKAQVYQQTGVDWKKIKLSLSDGNPSQSNIAPLLRSWYLQFGYTPVLSAVTTTQSNTYSAKQARKEVAMDEKLAYVDEMSMEGEYPAPTQHGISNYTNISESQLNINFDISIPYDILSNGKAHTVTLKEVTIPVSYRYYAVPKLDRSAFLMAAVANYSQYNLLPGEANIIFEGIYTGKTFLSPEQTTDTLSISLGRDPKVVVKREKITDKSDVKFLSSSKEQTFTFDISVRNNKKEAVNLILKDQYPMTPYSEIEVTLLEKSDAVDNKNIGVLTWTQDIQPNETKKVRLSYKVKYPKAKTIINL